MAKLVLAFEGKIIRSHQLGEGEICIGRNPACDIQIESLKVGDRHARIQRQAEGEYRLVADCAKPPVLVNHVPVSEHLLQHGDILQLGDYSLTFSDDPVDFIHSTGTFVPLAKAAPDEPAPPSAFLQITSGQALGRIIPLKRSLTRIGHAGTDTAAVAHRHDGYYISHLEGHPPTVGGQSVGEQAVLLKNGDVVKLGALVMEFHID
jgi:hypothetical protein